MTWLELGLAVLATVAVVLVPGVLSVAVMGLRGLALWALAAPAGASIIAVASIVAPFAGIPWSVVPVIGLTAIVVVVIAVLRRALRRLWPVDPPSRGRGAVTVIALAIAGALAVGQVALTIQTPENISQTFDNIFHLNAIRYVLDTANASPLYVGSLTSAPTGGVWYYPSGWHAVGALVVQLTGVSIPVASNALVVFFAAFAWPAGMLLLVKTLFGARRSILLVTGVVSVALPAFPLLMINYGVLFPYMMGLSLVPAAVAAVLRLMRIGVGSAASPGLWVTAVVGAVPGIFVAHPGAFMALVVFASVAVVCALVRSLRSNASRRRKAGLAMGAGAYAVFVVVAWYGLRPPEAARTWMPEETVGQAVGEVLTISVYGAPVGIAVGLLVAVGVVTAVRRRSTADVFALAALLAAALLYVVVAGLPYLWLRDVLTGSWYVNIPRLAALLPMAWAPLAAVGATAGWQWLTGRLEGMRGWRGNAARPLAAVLLLVLVVATQATAMRHAVQQARENYAFTDSSPLLSSDERDLLLRLPDHVPSGAVVAGSPWTGTALAYALAGRKVLMPHTLVDITPDMQLINDDLDEAKPGAAVCSALSREDVEFVLDFGDREVHGGVHDFPGLDELASSDSVLLVDQEGSARLYQVVGCGA